ncbi:hypothetical protein [Floricoccus penangensis]|uniref:hypothetical protein n=1 Tax=Floricoccus penangensis TaxID=1859475 RepID=UPI00203B96A8|nr:hypothetical protein [Floricoccus penangensis]URZ86524.1 hypothetical protein KIW23_05310 [Floricoccus penangensis]
MKRNIFNATFEESLNLKDDSLIDYMDKDTHKLPDPSTQSEKSKARIFGYIIVIFMIGTAFLISFICTKGFEGKLGESPFPKPNINFLPLKIFWVLFFVWLCITLIFRDRGEYFMSRFKGLFNMNTYIIWLVIEINLFFITFFSTTLTISVIISFFLILLFLAYFIFQNKIRTIKNILFTEHYEQNKLDKFFEKIITTIIKYGSIIVTVGIIWKIIFPNSVGRTDTIGLITFVLICIFVDIVLIFAEAYLLFPYLLYGYYKEKYSEDYRLYEGKTQLEWYGEKYFDKYIKGTKLEGK